MGYFSYKSFCKIKKRRLSLMAFCLIMMIVCIHASRYAHAESPAERFKNAPREQLTQVTLSKDTKKTQNKEQRIAKNSATKQAQELETIKIAER